MHVHGVSDVREEPHEHRVRDELEHRAHNTQRSHPEYYKPQRDCRDRVAGQHLSAH